MSRLTSRLPFNRSSAFDVQPTRPGPPLSPPETELEPVPQVQHDENYAPELQPGAVEVPITRFRRVAYSSTGLSNRDARSVQRQSKWLVMVMPPASLTREPPVLGHTLSSAPAGRFSNGILIPLFPTLYGQLTAIAREFNIPSTTGLCVYLQIQDNGISLMTPRISDESWQILWGHYFVGDERSVALPSHGLPISGRIEFDIDLRRAKWYNSWMGHPVRESADLELPSREPSMVHTHWRGDSRASFVPTDLAADESPSPPEPAMMPPSRLASQRHVPRPLLLERREASSIRSLSRHPSRAASISHEVPSPEEVPQDTSALSAEPTFVPNALSPVVQEQEEPQTAKRADLDTIVRQWREISTTGPTSTALAAAGQPSLDPVNMPPGTDVELDLNDFAWSISSAGPPTESPVSPHWPEPLPSVHISGRLQGSVCLTPSTCTSFGPPDYDWPESPVSFVSRRPSPDLGLRVLDFAPLTPSTVTSWGPDDFASPLDGEYSPEYRAPSIDLGTRGMGSRPMTPSTATSWGPADSPLFMPHSPLYIRTPDAGERVFFDVDSNQSTSQQRQALVWPYYNAWTTEPWGHVWPYQARYQVNKSITLTTLPPSSHSKVFLPEYPDFAALYPSDPSMERAATNKSQPVELLSSMGYPFIQPYPPVYPYHLDEIYPTAVRSQASTHDVPYPTYGKNQSAVPGMPSYRLQDKGPLPEYPDFMALYPSDLSIERAGTNKSQPVELPLLTGYPVVEPYPAVYPYHLKEIYPTLQLRFSVAAQELYPSTVDGITAQTHPLLPEYPDFAALYPADPTTERLAHNKRQPVQLPRPVGYPFFEIYETVYPYSLSEIYPTVSLTSMTPRKLSGGQNSDVQTWELLPEYPDFASLFPVDPSVIRAGSNKSQSTALPHLEGYPLIMLYPPVYPYNLEEIYPAINATLKEALAPSIAGPLLPEYPDFSGLYPSGPGTERVGLNKLQPVYLPYAGYPYLTIYTPVYPFNLLDIYGARLPSITLSDNIASREYISTRLPVYAGYPTFNLYPTSQGYPTFEIYPPIMLSSVSPELKMLSTKLTPAYPFLQVYEPVYPYLILYPPVQLVSDDGEVRLRPTSGRKRALTPGPGRPYSRLLSPLGPEDEENNIERGRSRSPIKRGIVPPLPRTIPQSSSSDVQPSHAYKPRTKPKRTHHDLHVLVFGNVLQQDPKSLEDVVPQLPSRVAPLSVPSRLRSRSGTVVGRPSSMTRAVPESAESPIHVRPATGAISRVPVTTNADPSPSTDPAILESSNSSVASPSKRSTAQSGYGLPPSPAPPSDSHLLNRVRSMNTQRRPKALDELSTAAGSRGLDRSRSMSDTSRLGTSRRSVVSERAKIFSVPERDVNTFDVHASPSHPTAKTAKPVAKLDRSKLPFA